MVNIKSRYWFKTELRDDFLRGYRVDYISKQAGITSNYLSILIHNKRPWSDKLINNIMSTIGYTKKEIKSEFNKYFERV